MTLYFCLDDHNGMLFNHRRQSRDAAVLEDMKRRDEQDRTRSVAPLKQAQDAILLDTSDLTIEQSAAALLGLIKERIADEEA